MEGRTCQVAILLFYNNNINCPGQGSLNQSRFSMVLGVILDLLPAMSMWLIQLTTSNIRRIPEEKARPKAFMGSRPDGEGVVEFQEQEARNHSHHLLYGCRPHTLLRRNSLLTLEGLSYEDTVKLWMTLRGEVLVVSWNPGWCLSIRLDFPTKSVNGSSCVTQLCANFLCWGQMFTG